jgi:K+-transporting ATPase KdpF subunit
MARKGKNLQELYIAATSILELSWPLVGRIDFTEVFRYGRHLSDDSRRPLRRYSRAGVGLRAAREDVVIIYGLAAVLALFLFGYLLYALLRAEQF